MNKQAETINATLPETVRSLLNTPGKEAYFPTAGIMAQAKEAKTCRINASIGVAFDEEKQPLVLPSYHKVLQNLDKTAFLYSHSYGNQQLRETWKKRILTQTNLQPTDCTLPVITAGITSALRVAQELFVNPETPLILPNLYWGNYKLIFKRETFTTYELFTKTAFNHKAFEEALEKHETASILFCFPNNPTGYLPTTEEQERITQTLREAAKQGKKLVVLIDDAYAGLGYEKTAENTSLFSKLATLHENIIAVKLDGITKEYFAWGLRVAFITIGYKGITPEAANTLEAKAAGIIRGTYSNVSTPAQLATQELLNQKTTEQERQEAIALLAKRYASIQELLQKEEYFDSFEVAPHNSGYFMCVKPRHSKAEYIRKRLLQDDLSVGVIATGGLIRVAFSSVPTNELEEVFDKIHKACQDLKK